MLSHIRVTSKAKKGQRKKQQQAATAATEKAVSGPDESCPSNYDIFDGHAAGNADVMESDDGEGTSGGAQSDIVHQGDNGNGGGGGVVGEMTGGYYTKFLFIKILLCCLSK